MSLKLKKLMGWEGFLLVVLLLIICVNSFNSLAFLTVENQVNLFVLSVEKIIIALIMTFIILNAEIDLSVASMMGLAACALGWMVESGTSTSTAIGLCLIIGLVGGAFNAYWITIVKLPSLVVTLAMLIGFRGLGRVLIEDRSIRVFPPWFENLGQQPILGPLPLSILIFLVLLVIAVVILQYTGFGRYVYVIGISQEVATYSGVRVARVKTILFMVSGLISALAGILFSARLGSVRGDMGLGFELDIITMVLLGGVSIFGGAGSIYGVILSILIVLYLRNGMSLSNVTGHIQTGVIGVILILSAMIPNIKSWLESIFDKKYAP
ncbi:MAG: ABC transporter permease [SAR324 cluster bacterium]|jgi:rhamnose transport system permease protein|nr:ATPase [Deltaproteobacteria bacterium]MDP6090616.1 ABC transporter permease [SAR324 cluster bacterium]MBP44798.1 ATPase [Deltaproteobacteria bacterium]MDP6245287.1 ABC transporter permease [SAR324 cluster bacterium]MDP6465084.1 ABC transporter permease [SAR324 cluster bacterium]|tara:strand:- start:1121 stop:2092 length:972 start_codon:yes stop_codon:yes gene_type:complete